MLKSITVSDIEKDFKKKIIKIVGDKNVSFESFSSIDCPKPNSITWISESYYNILRTKINDFSSTVFITEGNFNVDLISNKTFVFANKAKLLFIEILNKYFAKNYFYEIHPSAVIDKKAKIHKNVYIGPNCVLGNCIIDDGCVLEGNNFIYDNVEIGKNVILQAGAIIGSKGMSLSRNADNMLIGFPSLGKVIIEDDVEIGSNTVVDNAVLETTRIGKGTKINSLTFIGNTVCIGENNYISVSVNINGSVVIGNSNFIGSGSTIRNKINIGDNNTIGAGAVVVKNVENKCTVYGNPASVMDNKGIKL